MTEVVARGLDACLGEAMEIAVDGCDGVFLSVDVDVVDPGAAPGTGTPEPGGLSGRQLLDAVRRIAMEVPLAGMDVVEVAPPYDHAEITAFLAGRVVLEALAGGARRRQREAGEPVRQPHHPLLSGRPRQTGSRQPPRQAGSGQPPGETGSGQPPGKAGSAAS